MDEKREIRNIASQVIADEEKRTVEGYALLFGVSSDGLSFEEVIERGALDGVIEKSDVFALMNHSQSRGILARCNQGNGSLSLSVDSKGLKYRFEAPKTALGDELLENIRRGEINESSFCFDVEKDTWEKKSDGTWKRTVSKVGNLYDISPVYNAAYSKTSVYMRGKEQAEAELTRQNSENLNEYYSNIEKSLNI
ncbi:HK97 family phage prohead protease [Bacteroides sp.]|jgi:HK97 family phage prohead protease|uniref:HK97 family phage prohead protease n=1 Tax=Bacteroides sp. TaxID=29523 RepID=UPI002061F062|nr:HK97 family phage prohead protease [Bacteroides sp.]DAU79613.1 MAG TPA: prohead serine protease [Caudoviricetes sp.]